MDDTLWTDNDWSEILFLLAAIVFLIAFVIRAFVPSVERLVTPLALVGAALLSFGLLAL